MPQHTSDCPCPRSQTVPALTALYPPMGAHTLDKDQDSVTHHHLHLGFCQATRHRSAQPSHTVPGSPQMLWWDNIPGQQAILSSRVGTIMLLTLGAGTWDIYFHCWCRYSHLPRPHCSLPLPSPEARREYLCQPGEHMEGEGGTAEKDGTRDSTGVLAEVTVPENVQEGGEHRQPAGEPGKTDRGFAIALLSLA